MGQALTLDRVSFDRRIVTDSLIRTSMFLEPSYAWAAFHKQLAAALEDDTITRLVISVPPQHYKSTLACIMFPVWKLGNNPDLNIVVATYAAELAERHSYSAMNYFMSQRYARLFDHEIDPYACSKGHWQIKGRRGSYTATGIGGALTGSPADIAMVDDYYANSKEANSETVRKNVESWYRTVLCTRLQSEKSRIIIIATRWHEFDLIGMLLNEDREHRWKKLIFPAFVDYKEGDFFTGKPLLKSVDFYRGQIGLDAMSPIEFETMFMCNPTPSGDVLLSPDDWQVVPRLPDGVMKKLIRGHDIAYTGNKSSNDSANALVVRVGEEVFLLDADSWVLPWHESKARTKATIKNDDRRVVQWFETNGGQSAIVDDYKRDTDLIGHPIWGTESGDSKEIRALPWMLRVKGGQFKMVDGAHKAKVFNQCNHFRTGNNSQFCGIIDAISKAWEGMGNTVDLSGWLKS